MRYLGYILRLAFAVALCALAGCRTVEKTLRPSHFRNWVPEQALLPQAEFHGNEVTIRNVRNCQYFASDVYIVDYYDKTVDLNSVRAVDFIVVPFAGFPALAHTMISFEIKQRDGRPDYLTVSVETRKERQERYNPVKGSARQYELMYVLADECDVLQLRTNFNREDVFLYRTTATPAAARMLLVDVLGRVNQLAEKPEFYDTLTNNCTSNIVRHVNRIKPNRISTDVRTLLPGYSDQLAYDEGLIVRNGTFLETRQRAYINSKAQRFAGRDEFSEMIRK